MIFPKEMKGKGFKVFDEQEFIGGINLEGCSNYTRKQLDEIIDWTKRPQVGAKGLVWVKYNEDGSIKSSVDKFYSKENLEEIRERLGAKNGDLILIASGKTNETKKILGVLRLEMAERLGLRNPEEFAPLWVVDFPMFEKDKETGEYHSMHHPFTQPKEEDLNLLDLNPEKVKANAYDIILNGNEIGGGSLRIFKEELQSKIFKILGFSQEEANKQFGFLLNAFKYGAPPHGGIAFGFDRLVAILGGEEVIRDFIAFPKNNSGVDIMIDSPAEISKEQLGELNLDIK